MNRRSAAILPGGLLALALSGASSGQAAPPPEVEYMHFFISVADGWDRAVLDNKVMTRTAAKKHAEDLKRGEGVQGRRVEVRVSRMELGENCVIYATKLSDPKQWVKRNSCTQAGIERAERDLKDESSRYRIEYGPRCWAPLKPCPGA